MSRRKAAKERNQAVLHQHAAEYLAVYRRLSGRDPESTEAALRNGVDYSYFSTNCGRLHEALRDALDVAAAPSSEAIRPAGGCNEYRRDLPRDAIVILEQRD